MAAAVRMTRIDVHDNVTILSVDETKHYYVSMRPTILRVDETTRYWPEWSLHYAGSASQTRQCKAVSRNGGTDVGPGGEDRLSARRPPPPIGPGATAAQKTSTPCWSGGWRNQEHQDSQGPHNPPTRGTNQTAAASKVRTQCMRTYYQEKTTA